MKLCILLVTTLVGWVQSTTVENGMICVPGNRYFGGYKTQYCSEQECSKRCFADKKCNYATTGVIPGDSRAQCQFVEHVTDIWYSQPHISGCQKIDPTMGSWSIACTGTVASICTTGFSESTTNSFSVEHNTHWDMEVTASLEAGLEFDKVTVAQTSTWGQAITKTFQKTKTEEYTCTNEIHPDPKCVTNTTFNLVTWQFGSASHLALFANGNSVIATCLNYVTSSAYHVPKCLPGLCGDCECQTCLHESDPKAIENLKRIRLNLGLDEEVTDDEEHAPVLDSEPAAEAIRQSRLTKENSKVE